MSNLEEDLFIPFDQGFNFGTELQGIVDSTEFGCQVAGMIEEELKRSRRIVLAEHEMRGVFTRLMERVFEPISWFL